MSQFGAQKFVEQVGRNPPLIEQLRVSPDEIAALYGLDQAQVAALLDGSPPALNGIGVHPVLQMHFLLATRPEMASHVSVREYLADLVPGQP